MRSCRQCESVRIALLMASIVSSGSDWDTEATGAPPINASNLPVDDAGEGRNSGVETTEPNGDSSPPTANGNELLWNGGGVCHPMLVSPAATLEDKQRESNVDSPSEIEGRRLVESHSPQLDYFYYL